MNDDDFIKHAHRELIGEQVAELDPIRQEKLGQEQVSRNTRLPVYLSGCTEESLKALGFTLGAPIPNDPLFREGSIPEGWTMRSEGSIHTALIDADGNHRGYLSYKAASYDRWAQLQVK